jgi:hypothetical protein
VEARYKRRLARIEMMESNEHDFRNFQRHVDRLCFLIVATNCPDREIDIEKLHLRVQAMRLFPDKISLYDLIYESRFRRLREQFRQNSPISEEGNNPSRPERAT